MQGYETVVVLQPNVTETEQKDLLEKFSGVVKTHGGKVVGAATWGRRKLGYTVGKHDYGIYHLLYLDRTPASLKELDTQLRHNESVILWQSVAVNDVQKEMADFERLKTEGTLTPQTPEI
ncbi:MAG: 30S ribosomal protein S6 [Deltaproteobacteria bacterium]|nr:30S ribosomal protein S6 [Deltaproteobacteria bacterium]